ncbi:uncharacterized protein [Nicotiana tomentosiformis]|uniref:uncharacterized protein n=1 Tax=Nicotiana tomentosiformis TaxID=4098 RepID=UPI00051B75BC|nr:uncharacterized protein LOC104109932 [Nicotiana tomentosiformis]
MQKPSSHQKPPNSPLPKNPLDFSLFSPMQSSKNEHSLGLADYVGVESYVDLKSDLNLEPYKWFSGGGGGGFERREEERMAMKREKQKEKIEREYPPSIPWLSHTENLPTSQMPWVMKRYYTPDGRLIIKEEKVKRFEYFEAHRTNGRLMLNLVPLNDDVSCSDDDDDVDVDECVKEEENCDDSVVTGGCDRVKVDRTDGNESALVNGGGAPVIGSGGSGGGSKCSRLFTFGVTVPAIRPVHT